MRLCGKELKCLWNARNLFWPLSNAETMAGFGYVTRQDSLQKTIIHGAVECERRGRGQRKNGWRMSRNGQI